MSYVILYSKPTYVIKININTCLFIFNFFNLKIFTSVVDISIKIMFLAVLSTYVSHLS